MKWEVEHGNSNNIYFSIYHMSSQNVSMSTDNHFIFFTIS